ncbi:MAG: bifunctional DNA primase/polymerase [Candidatus Lutacidiplasmatales archaeon]
MVPTRFEGFPPILIHCLGKGWAIFPVRGKEPLTEHGHKDASRDPGQWIRWLDQFPDCGWAAPTGELNGFDVLDADTAEAVADLSGRLRHGPRVSTARGIHFYFKHSPGARSWAKRLKGCDFKGEGGYVVLAGSPHESGTHYEWVEGTAEIALPETPAWVFDLHLGGFSSTVPGAKYVEGERNDRLFRLACAIQRKGGEVLKEVLRANDELCAPPLDHAEVVRVAASAERYPRGVAGLKSPESPSRGSGESAADRLVEIASGAELFHDDQLEAFATVEANGHFETYRVRSVPFRRWLVFRYRSAYGKVPSPHTVQAAILSVEAAAQIEGQCVNVHTRVGWDGEALWIDLGGPTWRTAKVTTMGWEICDWAAIKFVRGKSQAPLPIPRRDGSIAALVPFLGAESVEDEHFVQAVSWLVGSFHPFGPYPVLYLLAEQGSGKSSAARYLRGLIDPSSIPTRSLPREERDLAVAARGSWVLSFDNVSTISGWLSDALSRLSTGGGFGTRTLYTDDDETLFGGRRPVLMNGIPQAIVEPDLRDRALVAHWPRIALRRSVRDLDGEFEAKAGGIFGALLDALSSAIRSLALEAAQRKDLPRMADFAVWVEAAEPRLPWRSGRFAEVFESTRASATQSVLSESLVAQSVIQFISDVRNWEGTATSLLDELTETSGFSPLTGRRSPKDWPASPKTLSQSLRKLAPDLRSVGIWVTFDKAGKERTRLIRLSTGPGQNDRDSASAASAPSAIATIPDGGAPLAAGAEADAKDAADARFPPFYSRDEGEVEPLAEAADRELSSVFARFGLDGGSAFPGLHFLRVKRDPARVAVVAGESGRQLGRPWHAPVLSGGTNPPAIDTATSRPSGEAG